MFKVRVLKEEDYDTLCKWWKDWRWKPVERDFLPENGTGGIMVYKDDVEICAGYIYFTNSKVCWSEFLISNFNYREGDRKEAIKLLIDQLNEIAKSRGCKYIYTVVKSESLENTYKELGYINGTKKVNELIKIL